MRKFSAWILLLVATFQWSGCLLTFQLSKESAQIVPMSNLERRFSDKLELETGSSFQLTKLPAEQNLSQIGYSNAFLISEEVEGELVSFRLSSDSYRVVTEEKTIGLSPEQKQEGQIASILQFSLTEYITQSTSQNPLPWVCLDSSHSLYNTSSSYFYFGSLDTPPPQVFS